MKTLSSLIISKYFGINHAGPDILIKTVRPISNLKKFSISWCKIYPKPSVFDKMESIGDIYVILPKGKHSKKYKNVSYSVVENPRNIFNNILRKYFTEQKTYGISTSAIISNDVKLGKKIYIGDYTKISGKVNIGENCFISDNCIIKGPAIIGDGTEILPGAVIGHDSLGLTIENDTPKLFPQLGGIKIGKNCRLGVNSSVSRGTLDDTIINNNVMLGDYAHVGHNSKIDNGTIITAGSIICGKVEIGKNVWLGAGCKILENVKINSNIKIGIGAIVFSSLNRVGTYIGNPAKRIK